MTMILTCLANDYIVQASDRRLSYWDGKKVVITNNDSNKALIYKNQFVFAYTGLADLSVEKNRKDAHQSAIDWTAQRLSAGKNLEDAVYHLQYRLTELMNSNRMRKLPESKRRLALMGAGFDESERGSKRIRRPLRIVIENCIGEDGTLLSQPRDEFRVHYDPLKRRDAALFVAGQQLHLGREIEFIRFLRGCVQHKVKPETIGVHLTREILAVADKNDYVGKNIMITFVPRAYGDNMGLHTGGILIEPPVFSAEPQQLKPAEDVPLEYRIVILPPFDSPRYMYIPGDNKALPYHSPLYVRPGRVMGTLNMSDMSITIPAFVPAPNQEADTPL